MTRNVEIESTDHAEKQISRARRASITIPASWARMWRSRRPRFFTPSCASSQPRLLVQHTQACPCVWDAKTDIRGRLPEPKASHTAKRRQYELLFLANQMTMCVCVRAGMASMCDRLLLSISAGIDLQPGPAAGTGAEKRSGRREAIYRADSDRLPRLSYSVPQAHLPS